MAATSGPSFISYVTEAERNHEVSQKIAKVMNNRYEGPDKEMEGRLLQGEIVIGRTNQVLRYNVHDDPARGISGTLVCTNFRLVFLTVEKATYDLIELQNRLMSEHDILLNSIESIFVEYSNKRKKLVPSSKVKDGIQRLEVHCKDFRVAAFNFKLSQKGDEKGVITALLHHAYPQKVTRLFAFDYKHDKDASKACKVPLYRTQADWDEELCRCSVSRKQWKVTVVNKNFTALPTMAALFVVPSALSDSELTKAGAVFSGGRIPIWCWTDSNGCSLVRSPTLRPEVEQHDTEARLHEAIRRSDLKQRAIKVINVSKSCPSCLQLQQSFNKLKSVCMPATESDFWDTDSHWYSTLNSTKWLQHISTVLSTAREAAEYLRRKEHNVIIQENVGVDLTSVVTSLIQLILDPSCRRLHGFQALIQREWVVAGHPFLDRLGHLLQPKKKGKAATLVTSDGDTTQLAPVFLLFLDCVYQLMSQFPARFEPSFTFLTVLHDATRTAAFDTFIFNNERQRHRKLCEKEWQDQPFALNEVEREPTIEFLPLWAWEVQFNESDMKLFNNPLYRMRTMNNYRQYVEESTMTGKRKSFCSDVSGSENNAKDGTSDLNGDVIDGTMTSFSKAPFTLDAVPVKSQKGTFLHGVKKKTNVKDMKMEEHRRKIEMDSPHPLNKIRQKSGSLEEKNKRLPVSGSTGEKSGIIKEKKEPFRGTPGGHFPKVALMPKQRTPPKAAESNEDDGRLSRSKSDSEYCDGNGDVVDEEGKVQDDGDVLAPLNDVVARKPTDPESPKLKSRFSLRRRKTKDTLEFDDSLCDVPTYAVRLQDASADNRTFESAGSLYALYPSSSIPEMKLWRQCYFRWLPWSQIYGGGPASTLQQESILYDEIHILHNKLQMLNKQLHSGSQNFHPATGLEDASSLSGMYFGSSQENLSRLEGNSLKSSSQNSLNILPSYFPYSPVKGLRRKSVIGTPMSNFLQGGSFFNFGRSRNKHTRSQSGLSIAHSLAQSIEDLASMAVTDGTTSSTESPASKSLEDLAPELTPIRDRTHSDVPGRGRLKLLPPGAEKPRKLTPSPTSTSPPRESITYITSL